MSFISANTITKDFLTSKGGLEIGHAIENQLKKNPDETIDVSFSGIPNVAPSFINGAFLYLIDRYGSDYFRSRVKVVNASSEVAKTIGDSVRNYLDHQTAFYSTLKTNLLYFASDGSQNGEKLIAELKKISNENQFTYILNPSLGQITNATRNEIERSDALIGILTDNEYENHLGAQIEIATQLGKPCLLLLHKNLKLRLPTASHQKIQVIYYDNLDYLDQLRKINEIIMRNKRSISHNNNNLSNKSSENDEAIGALIVIALLAALFFLLIRNENENISKKQSFKE